MAEKKKKEVKEVTETQAFSDGLMAAIYNKGENPFTDEDPRKVLWQRGHDRGLATRNFHSTKLSIRLGTNWFNNIDGL